MYRLLWGCWFAATMAHGQEATPGDRGEVKASQLFPMGKRAIEVAYADGIRHPEFFEYRIVSQWAWIEAPWMPEFLDLIALVENSGAAPVGPVEVDLYRDLKIGDSLDGHCNLPPDADLPPHPRESAVWLGPILVDTQRIDYLEGNTAIGLSFDPFSMHGLKDEFLGQPDWPWVLRFEVALRCAACSRENSVADIRFLQVC